MINFRNGSLMLAKLVPYIMSFFGGIRDVLSIHFAAGRYTENAEKILAFENAVEELAKRLSISREGFRNDDFSSKIKAAVLTVTNEEMGKLQTELVTIAKKEADK